MWGISYWILPLISGFMWLATLTAMIAVWCTEGRPHYSSMSPGQTIAYISDVGAQGLKPLFITGCVITTAFLDLSLVAERWLRHSGRLAKNRTKQEKVVSALSILCAIGGTVGLVGLSIADTLRHPRLHNVFLGVFIVGYVLSAIFICWEYQRLGIRRPPLFTPRPSSNTVADFREHRVLRASFWIKLFFILLEVALVIAFGICSTKHVYNVAAVFEWVVSYVFSLYIFSFFVDLIPAVRGKGVATRRTRMQNEANDPEADAELDRHRSRENERGMGQNYYGDGSRVRSQNQREAPQGGTRQDAALQNMDAHMEMQQPRAHTPSEYDGAYDINAHQNGFADGNGDFNGPYKPYPVQPPSNF